MIITVCYERRNFFGAYEYTQETNEHAGKKELEKAFKALKKDRNFAVHIDSKYCITWNSFTDFENGIILIREYEAWNSYNEKKCSFENMKKAIYKDYE